MGHTDLRYMCIDVEVTNRCNAGCDFCPRARTPHEGVMHPYVFDAALRRAVEFRDLAAERLDVTATMSFCGLGEGMLNRELPAYVARAAVAGFEPRLCSNGSLLTEQRSRLLIEAGLREIFVNCGDLADDYDRVYKVPFARMRDNVIRFMELAGDRCEVHIVLVDHRQDRARVERIREYWRSLGVTHFFKSPMLNRAGTIDVDNMRFAAYPEHARAVAIFEHLGVKPVCAAAFAFPFIGYDGNYYLCSSDWEKQVPVGNVFDDSFLSILRRKLAHVERREPICRSCCHDPYNHMTAALRATSNVDTRAGDPRILAAMFVQRTEAVYDLVARATPYVDELAPARTAEQARIPVQAI